MCNIFMCMRTHAQNSTLFVFSHYDFCNRQQMARLDYSTLRNILKTAASKLKDDERFVVGAALMVVKHAVDLFIYICIYTYVCV